MAVVGSVKTRISLARIGGAQGLRWCRRGQFVTGPWKRGRVLELERLDPWIDQRVYVVGILTVAGGNVAVAGTSALMTTSGGPCISDG